MNYLFLDYDGFVAKSYFASISKDNTDKDKPEVILQNLIESALERAEKYFNNSEGVMAYKILSGHTFKKDIFPGYKGKRERNEGLGEFRDWVKKNEKGLLIADNLEADDLITFCNSMINYSGLVFSDDKDLRKYNPVTCKLNPLEEVLANFSPLECEQYIQMITGDTIDNIKGIPRRGEMWARKYLDKNGYSFENVIKAYKENNINIDECLKNIVEVTPVCPEFIDENYSDWMEELFEKSLYYKKEDKTTATLKCIEGFIRYISQKVREVYYD